MFPYFEQPSFSIGSHTIYAFSVLVLVAVAVGFEVVLRRARRTGLDREQMARLLAWTIVGGLFGSHLLTVFTDRFEQLLRDPLELLRIWGGMSWLGGVAGGLLGAFIAMRRRGLSRAEMARFIDCVAYATPFAQIFGRGGCALAHDHPGIPSTHWLAVRFPDGPRFDLGLIEFFYVLMLSALFAWVGRYRRPPGFFLGLYLLLYGPARFAMDSLRTGDVRYLGWTASQYLALATAVGGAALLTAVFHAARRR